MSELVEDHNTDQRQKIANLGLEALDTIDGLDGPHMLADAVLLFEVISPETEAEGRGSTVFMVATVDRLVVQRGIIEQARDGMMAMLLAPSD